MTDLFPYPDQPIGCSYSTIAYGGDGTWSNYRWLQSWDDGLEQLVSTSPFYTESYPAGSYRVLYHVSATSFGEDASFSYQVIVHPRSDLDQCRFPNPC